MSIPFNSGPIESDVFDTVTSTSSAISFEGARIAKGDTTIADTIDDFLTENFTPVDSVTFQGDGFAGFFFDEFSVPGIFALEDGILISSGAFPGDFNSESGFSVSSGSPAGDPDLDLVAEGAFGGAGQTADAVVIEFEILITDPAVDGFSFDLVFGSEEFPEFSDSSFVDVAAVFVNGQNVALFNDDPSTPLSVIDENLVNGNFINNDVNGDGDFDEGEFDEGEFEDEFFDEEDEFPEDDFGLDLDPNAPEGGFATEMDGISDVLTIRAPLTQGLNTIKIGIADTGDSILDSILALANFELLTDGGTGGGVLQVVEGSDEDEEVEASLAPEEINLVDGMDEVTGTAEELDGDIITDFSDDDTLVVEGETFDADDITVTFGSAILGIDVDGDGEVDTTITLAGDFEGAEFATKNTGDGTEITVEFPPELNEVLGTAGNDRLTGTDEDDRIVSEGGRFDRMSGGDGADQFVFGAEANNGVRERDIISDFELIDSIVLEDGAQLNSVRDMSSGVLVSLQGGDAIIVYGEVNSDTITIVTDDTPL